MVRTLLAVRPDVPGCPLSLLGRDLVYYIVNMCRHDWCPPSGEILARIEAERAQAEAMERSLETLFLDFLN